MIFSFHYCYQSIVYAINPIFKKIMLATLNYATLSFIEFLNVSVSNFKSVASRQVYAIVINAMPQFRVTRITSAIQLFGSAFVYNVLRNVSENHDYYCIRLTQRKWEPRLLSRRHILKSWNAKFEVHSEVQNLKNYVLQIYHKNIIKFL